MFTGTLCAGAVSPRECPIDPEQVYVRPGSSPTPGSKYSWTPQEGSCDPPIAEDGAPCQSSVGLGDFDVSSYV